MVLKSKEERFSWYQKHPEIIKGGKNFRLKFSYILQIAGIRNPQLKTKGGKKFRAKEERFSCKVKNLVSENR